MSQVIRKNLLRWLDFLIAATGGGLGDASLGLYKSITGTVGPDQVIGNIEPADYPGYAPIALTAWSLPYFEQAGPPVTVGPLCHFVPTGSDSPNTILGAYIYGSDTFSPLMRVDAFPAPVGLTDPDTALDIVPRYSLDPGADYGDDVIID